MTLELFALVLLVTASVGPTVERIESDRFRVKIVFDNTESPRAHANAQIALIRKARDECRGKGDAQSEGMFVSNAPPIRGDRKALELAEIYSCVRD